MRPSFVFAMSTSFFKSGTQTIRLKDFRANPANYTGTLQASKASPGHVLCQCKPHDPLRLQLRKHGDVILVAVWPEEGPLHATECDFYRDDVKDAAAAWATKNGIEEDEQGNINIKPGFLLSRATKKAPTRSVTATPTSASNTAARRSAGLSAILHMLWNQAQNNRWFNRPRQLSDALYHVLTVMERTELGKQKMTKCTYVAGARTNSSLSLSDFKAYLSGGESGVVRAGLLIGEIETLEPSKFGYQFMFQKMTSAVYCSDALELALRESYPRVYAEKKYGEKIIGLLHVELTAANASGDRHYKATDAALLLTSRDYIPVDSSYESLLCNKLVDSGRRFTKPMTVEDEVLPDFILDDLNPKTFMEVWGMKTPAYLQRKQGKLDLYAKRGVRLWQWDAVSHPQNPPALPVAN